MHTERTAKLFAEKLNSKLDDLDLPNDFRQRIQTVAKILKVSPERVRFWLSGYQIPNDRELKMLADELGIDMHHLHHDHSQLPH